MGLTEQEHEAHFENEVRRIARELWPEAEFDGSIMAGGRERDGVFETEDCLHLIESTVSRSRQKAEDDAKKLVSLARKEQTKHPQKAIKSWFITENEPTADQRTVIKDKYPSVTPISFAQFQSKLIDAGTYLSLRMNYPFGSVRDPATGSSKAEIEYVALDVIERSTQLPWSVSEVRSGLLDGKRFIVFGDYGSGKSMTLREIFRELRTDHLKGKTPHFPLYINLRDHFGQTNPSEVLERHARNIGFPNPSHLVRAWHAGYAVLLIDGFDELTTLGIQGLWKRLHEVRYRAMEVIRQFVRDQPLNAGLILAGRDHFFDSERERNRALGSTANFSELTLNEFNDQQIQRYLTKRGLKGSVPYWMPSRPLLIGYLAASGIFQQVFSSSNPNRDNLTADPATGWDYLLDRICEREADIEAGIDGPTVRRILERLSTFARLSQSGLGPLSPQTISTAFLEICGYEPDEKGSLLLQRLPGLGTERHEEGTRIFIDQDFADACRAGDILLYMTDPFGPHLNSFRHADHPLGDLAIGLILIKAETIGISSGKLVPALRKAQEAEEFSALVLDIVRIAIESGCSIEIQVQLTDILVPLLELSADIKDLSKLSFVECLFSRLVVEHEVDAARMPRFRSCYVDELEGRASVGDLPQGVFDKGCEFGRFTDAPNTTTAIAGTDLPIGAKVMLTVLKKIYLQSGSGRKENALQRGLDHHSRRLVVPVLRLLQAEGIVAPYKRAGLDMTIWTPDRAKTARVQKLITAPRTCADALIQKASDLN